jgi:hypothetical protein
VRKLFLLALLLAIPAGSSGQTVWQRYKVPETGAKVDLPDDDFHQRRWTAGGRLWSAVHNARRPGDSCYAINTECRPRFTGCIFGEKEPAG